MSKRVLIVSYFFAPQNAIGAVRPTKLAKFLTRMGYDVTVICGVGVSSVEDPALRRDLEELRDVRVVVEPNLLRALSKRRAQPKAEGPARESVPAAGPSYGRLHALMDALYRACGYLSDRAFARRAIGLLRGDRARYDAVISSYGPHSCHRVARYAKRKKIATRWVADFRDNVTMPFGWMNGGIARYLDRVRREADAITVASEGFLRMMGLTDCGQAVTNGYDTEDLRGVEPIRADGRLTLMYSGQLFGFERDLTPVFDALRELIDEGELETDALALCYAGRDEASFLAQADRCGLKSAVVSHGYVDRGTALGLELGADALLFAARNTRAVYGNLPGKLLEYLMLGKPVIGCVCGDKGDCDASRVLAETRAGFCYEEAGGEAAREGLKAALRALCRAHRDGEAAPFAPDKAALARYTHAEMARRFAALIESNEEGTTV